MLAQRRPHFNINTIPLSNLNNVDCSATIAILLRGPNRTGKRGAWMQGSIIQTLATRSGDILRSEEGVEDAESNIGKGFTRHKNYARGNPRDNRWNACISKTTNV